jgi:hypothetical protein
VDGKLGAAAFNEPGGLAWLGGRLYVADTNNQQVRVLDPVAKTVASLELVLKSGATETADPAVLGMIDKEPEQHWPSTQARPNIWVTDYGVFIKDDGKIFPGFPNCGTTIGRGNDFEAGLLQVECYQLDGFGFVIHHENPACH